MYVCLLCMQVVRVIIHSGTEQALLNDRAVFEVLLLDHNRGVQQLTTIKSGNNKQHSIWVASCCCCCWLQANCTCVGSICIYKYIAYVVVLLPAYEIAAEINSNLIGKIWWWQWRQWCVLLMLNSPATLTALTTASWDVRREGAEVTIAPDDGDGDDDDDAVLKISLTSNSNVLLAAWVTTFIQAQHVVQSILNCL